MKRRHRSFHITAQLNLCIFFHFLWTSHTIITIEYSLLHVEKQQQKVSRFKGMVYYMYFEKSKPLINRTHTNPQIIGCNNVW